MQFSDGTSPPLTLRPNMAVACHQSAAMSETHVTHQLSYSQHLEANAGGGANASSPGQGLDVSDPKGNSLALLRKGLQNGIYIHSRSSDDEKNKMLPEAASINQDGSQDGLMEAANIPLQSKEEDQM